MGVTLTDEQVAGITGESGTRYSREQWETYVKDAVKTGTSRGRCEDDFPGVKPAHVRHMFRLILKADAELAKKAQVAKTDEYGIVLKVTK